jgi:hypothetical protein
VLDDRLACRPIEPGEEVGRRGLGASAGATVRALLGVGCFMLKQPEATAQKNVPWVAASRRSGENDSAQGRAPELNNPFLENEPTMSFRIIGSFLMNSKKPECYRNIRHLSEISASNRKHRHLPIKNGFHRINLWVLKCVVVTILLET